VDNLLIEARGVPPHRSWAGPRPSARRAPGCSTFVATIIEGAPALGRRIAAAFEPRPVGDGCVSQRRPRCRRSATALPGRQSCNQLTKNPGADVHGKFDDLGQFAGHRGRPRPWICRGRRGRFSWYRITRSWEREQPAIGHQHRRLQRRHRQGPGQPGPPLLNPNQARQRPPWPYVALTCNDNRLTTSDTARFLLTLAPSLALRRSLAPLRSATAWASLRVCQAF
jgi:hypothetical protein